jgi:hypothetical protein
MEPEGSLPCSQEPATGFEPGESTPHPHNKEPRQNAWRSIIGYFLKCILRRREMDSVESG